MADCGHEALRAAKHELLELEEEKALKHAIAKSLDDAPGNLPQNPQDKQQAWAHYENTKKRFADKTRQKDQLERRLFSPNNRRNPTSAGSSTTSTSSDGMDFWPVDSVWGQASVPYRTITGSSFPTVRSNPSASHDTTGPPLGRHHQLSYGSSGQSSLVTSNKRSHGAASLSLSGPGRHKSQRTHDASSDVIDLTGEDDEADASCFHVKQPEQEARGNRHASNGDWARNFGEHSYHASASTSANALPSPGFQSDAMHVGGFQGAGSGNSHGNTMTAFPYPMGLPSFPRTNIMSAIPGSYFSGQDDEDSLSFRTASQMFAQPAPSFIGAPNRTVDVINRTRNFNFMDLTDGDGNRLDPRVASVMQDINDDPRRSREEVEALLKNVHAGMEILAEAREGTPTEMRYPLYTHQQVALTWMKRQEKGSNKGGILADDMGLGKTISVLSLIVSHKATQGPKTTLIVAPLSLIRQWEDEIKKKIKSTHTLLVTVYHNTQKAQALELMKNDVVLTTYGTLVSEKKKLANWVKNSAGRKINTKTDPGLASLVSLFHPDHSHFYRVVLDESQMIKNSKAQASLAVASLKSKYRWCLSGTPMMNGVDELYSSYKFLGIKPYNNWTEFRRAFGVLFGKKGDPQAQAMKNLQVLLKATMLRRTKGSEIDGKPILQLPEKSEEVIYAALDEDERKFYSDLESQSQVQINKYLRKGTLGKHYSHVLVLLLRLRQSCCHPHLLLDSDEAAPEVDSGMLERVQSLSAAVVLRLTEKSRAVENGDAMDEGFECPICYDIMPDPTIPLPCGHELCAGCLKQHVENANRDNIRNGEEDGPVKCAVCRGPLDPQNVITFSAFKRVHMPKVNSGSSEEESDGSVWTSDDEAGRDEDDGEADQSAEKQQDVEENGSLRNFIVPDDVYGNISDDDDDDDDDRSSTSSEPKPPQQAKGETPSAEKKGGKKAPRIKEAKKRRKKIKGTMLQSLRKEAKKNAAAWKDYTKYLSHHWLSSAKARACMELLRKIQDTGEKTIVFSQWTMLLDLLEVALKKESLDIRHCRYTGEMSMSQRDDVAYKFTTDPNMKVMMVSLRAGNAGLNLVAASRVVIMDPFWNPYIEMQAVDRAHRIGQQKPVKVYRILTQETVEDRIVQLQEKKRATVDAALDEREGAKLAGLSLTELRFLFNL